MEANDLPYVFCRDRAFQYCASGDKWAEVRCLTQHELKHVHVLLVCATSRLWFIINAVYEVAALVHHQRRLRSRGSGTSSTPSTKSRLWYIINIVYEVAALVHHQRRLRSRGSGTSSTSSTKSRLWYIINAVYEVAALVHHQRRLRSRGSGTSSTPSTKSRLWYIINTVYEASKGEFLVFFVQVTPSTRKGAKFWSSDRVF